MLASRLTEFCFVLRVLLPVFCGFRQKATLKKSTQEGGEQKQILISVGRRGGWGGAQTKMDSSKRRRRSLSLGTLAGRKGAIPQVK